VIPTAANAVSVAEYAYAYMLPILFGTIFCMPTFLELILAGWTISMCNLAIHTPILHDLSDNFPECLVTTAAHSEHHRILHAHCAAPTFNVDWLLAKVQGKAYARCMDSKQSNNSNVGVASYEEDRKAFEAAAAQLKSSNSNNYNMTSWFNFGFTDSNKKTL